MATEQGVLLPFYLVVDVSYSMLGGKLDAANRVVPEVADALARHPILEDKIRFGFIDFSDDARVVLPLCNLSEQTTLPGLSARGGTSYAAAFTLLRSQLERDATQLRADGFKVHRPAVFFLSDGEPTDATGDWKAAFAALTEYDKESRTGFMWYPVLIPFGVGDADRDTMRQLVFPASKSKLYMMSDGQDAAAAIRAMAEILVSSIIASGQSAAAGGSGVILPAAADVPTGLDVEDDWLN